MNHKQTQYVVQLKRSESSLLEDWYYFTNMKEAKKSYLSCKKQPHLHRQIRLVKRITVVTEEEIK